MPKPKEQTFVAQKCGENCTCHNLIKQEKSKTIYKSEISANLIRGVDDNGTENKEIANKNANVHNFLAHMKYRILDGYVKNKDTELLIFQDPPADLIIHPNGLIKHAVDSVYSSEVKELFDLPIKTPADIRTFAEKLIQIDCNTYGLDKLITCKIKNIKTVIAEHNNKKDTKPLKLSDINEAYLEEDTYKKRLKQIVESALNVKDNKVVDLATQQVSSLSSNNSLIELNNEYRDTLSTNVLFMQADNLVVPEKTDEQKKTIIEKILNFLGINAHKNVAVQAVVGARANNTGTDEEAAKKLALALEQKALEQKRLADALAKKELKKQELKKQKADDAAKKLALALAKEKLADDAAKKLAEDAEKERLEKQKADDAEKQELEDAEKKRQELKKQEDALAKQKEAAKKALEQKADEAALEQKKLAEGQNYNKDRNSETNNNVSYLNYIFKSCSLESFYKHKASGNNITYVSPATSKKPSFLKEINGLIGVSIPTEEDKKTSFDNNKARYDAVEEKYKKYIISKKKPDDIKISIIQATALSALDKSLALLNSRNKKDIKNFLYEMNQSLKEGEHMSGTSGTSVTLPKNLLLNMIYKTGIKSYDQDTLKKAITDKKIELRKVYSKIEESNKDNINHVGDNALKIHLKKIEPQKTLQK